VHPVPEASTVADPVETGTDDPGRVDRSSDVAGHRRADRSGTLLPPAPADVAGTADDDE